MKNHKTKEYAEKLTKLMREHPNSSVVVKIDTEGIDTDYGYMCGYMYESRLEEIIVGYDGCCYDKENDVYEDCYNYYGSDAGDWTDEELEEKAKAIPWEKVIAVNVSAT